MQHSEETFEGRGGTRLFSQSWLPEGPKKATLIIVHGLHDYSARYAWAAEDLAKVGIAVYSFDLRGHGKSEGRLQSIETYDDYQEDLGRFVKSVQAKEPGRPLFLFGFSLGGNIVASYALDNQGGISGVIMAAPPVKAKASGFAIALGRIMGELAPNAGTFKVASKDFSSDPAIVTELDNDPLICKKGVPARTALYILRSGDRLRAEAVRFEVPLLVMQGTADRIVDMEGGKLFYEQSHSSDKTLKLYDGFYHELLHEPGKQTVLNDLSDWLAKRS